MDMNIYKPTEEDLQPLLKEATATQTKEEWIKKFLKNLKGILQKEPLRYRAFGPYWWTLKKMYIDIEDLSFGEFIDAEWLKAMDYGKQEMNILAAYIYEDERTSKNLVDDPFHSMPSLDGSEAVEFASSDPDMEIRLICNC